MRHSPRLISWLFLGLLTGVLLFSAPKPTKAFLGIGDQTFATIVADPLRSIWQAAQKAYTAIKERIGDATAVAFKNGARTFIATTVREFATSLATTAPGQKPLFLTNPKTFFRDVTDAAAGNFIDDFTKGVTGGTWDARCDSSDPVIRKQCDGIQGGTTKSGTLDQKGRFIISRLLRAGAQGTLDLCQEQCKTDFGYVNQTPIKYSQAQQLKSLDSITGYNNVHEQKAALIRAWIETANVGTKALKEQNPNQGVVCRDVFDSAGTVFHTGEVIYAITPGMCAPGTTPPLGWSCNVTAQECYNRQTNALNNELDTAGKELTPCMKSCNSPYGSTVRSLVNQATATDIFSYVENFDIRRSPELIANKFSGKSDVSQYFSAAASLTATIQSKVTGESTYLKSGVLPRTTKVSQEVMTPSEGISALFGIPTNTAGELTYTGHSFADILNGITSFLNSPVGKALFTYFKSKCGLNPSTCSGPQNPTSAIGQILFGSSGTTGLAAARQQFAGLGQAEIITGDPGKNQVDTLSQLSTAGLLDPQFESAIEQGLTITEAINQKLLSSQKIVGFNKNGIEPQDGYPYRELQYLRKYRIISVGWELAAKYNLRFQSQDLTLDTLVKHYNICAQDSSHKVCSSSLKTCQQDSDCQSGEACGASPYCGLVDPNWVLKAPQTFCRRQGAGEEIVSKEFVCDQNNVDKESGKTIPYGINCTAATEDNNGTAFCHDISAPNCVFDADQNTHPDVGHWVVTRNTDTCADSESCLVENDDGTCQAYGYCAQERNSFKFDGDNCDAQNATCRSYVTSSGEKVAYLSKNLDYASCSADSAGCQWYCAKPSYDAENKIWTCTNATGNKVYLTAKAGSCSANQVGCRQFIRLVTGSNYLPNGGFEYYEGGQLDQAPGIFTGWSSGLISMMPVTPSDSSYAGSGNAAAVLIQAPESSNTISQTVNLGSALSSRAFTFSLRAKSTANCSGAISLCTGNSCASAALGPSATMAATSAWQTYAVTLAVPPASALPLSTTQLTAQIQPDGCRDSGLVIDSAQLQETTSATPFIEYGASNLIYLNANRRSCQPADVGCDKYTPVGGGTAVNGIVQDNNRCDKNYVGCQLFHREPIAQIPYRDYSPTSTANGKDLTIVAPQGKQCAAADVGCEEYTNLDAVGQGGESKTYFKSVKQCVKPTNTAVTQRTYYTWVGDNDKGFVLRSYQLVAQNNSAGAAPCTKLSIATNVSTNPTCADDSVSIAAATCQAGDLATNPDCTEFYDSNLNVFYRLRSKTVSVTNDCRPYRNTIDETDADYAANRGRVYFLSAKENTSCSAANAGCRAYTGNTGKASRAIIKEQFENHVLSAWVGGSWSNSSPNAGGHSLRIDPPTGGTNGIAFTAADILKQKMAKGKTYILSLNAAAASGTGSIRLRAYLGTGNDADGTFDTNSAIGFLPTTGVSLKWNEDITPSGPEWQNYVLGPLTIDQVYPEWRLGIISEGGPAYVDNVTLTEVNDRVYQINNSAPLCPASAIGCAAYRNRAGLTSYLTGFTRLCSNEVVGCEAMIDTQNSVSPFAQTIKDVTMPADSLVTMVNDSATYCQASAKGCDMYGDPVFGRDNTISGFKTVYKINDPDLARTNMCLASEESCAAFTNSDQGVEYFKDPRNRTCEFRTTSSSDSGAWYLTGTSYPCPLVTPPTIGQPVGKSCSPVCDGGSRDGKPCSTNASCPGGTCPGDPNLIGRVRNAANNPVLGQCSVDSDCADSQQKCVYLVGICPAETDGCTEYRDPTDPVSCRSECPLQLQGGTAVYVDTNCVKTVCVNPGNRRDGQNCQTSDQCGTGGICVGTDRTSPTNGAPGCRSYYYLKKSVEDTASDCNGEVNSLIGCRAFNDTSNPVLNFRGQ